MTVKHFMFSLQKYIYYTIYTEILKNYAKSFILSRLYVVHTSILESVLF